jgi:hypothetical protein
MRDFVIDDPNFGGIKGNVETLLNSNLRTERSERERKQKIFQITLHIKVVMIMI